MAPRTSSAKVTVNETPTRRVVTLRLEDAPGRNVFVAGTFNNWMPEKRLTDRNNDGVYTAQLRLEPGEYQYKFVVDGEWRLDSENPAFAPNGFGELNSVLKVAEK